MSGGAGLDVADLSTDTQAQPDAPRPRRLGNRAAPGASTRWTASYMPDVHARGSRAERWRARIPPRSPIPDDVAVPDTGRSCGARYRAKLRCLIPGEVAMSDTGRSCGARYRMKSPCPIPDEVAMRGPRNRRRARYRMKFLCSRSSPDTAPDAGYWLRCSYPSAAPSG